MRRNGQHARKNTSIKLQSKPSLVSGLAISVVTVVLGLLAINKALEMYYPDVYHWDHRLMFFSNGSVFQNKPWGGFVYAPSSRINSRTIYITNAEGPEVVDEYASQIITNSAGLVQLTEISDTKPSIIFLGDSFTEGQGATPWFYTVERKWPTTSSHQVINGGILGTGFEAWQRLYDELSSKTKIDKIVVIFISNDWARPVQQISQHDLDCLEAPRRCGGTNNFIGLFDNSTEADNEVLRIAAERVNALRETRPKLDLIKTSAMYQRILKPAYYLLFSRENSAIEAQFERNKTAVKEIVRKVGAENIIFIQLPQKDELYYGISNLGRRGKDFIRETGLVLVDGFKECNLTISDFHTLDGHPNAKGYDKIESCVMHSVKTGFPALWSHDHTLLQR